MVNLIDFHIFGDNRGSLISLEENKNIPFDIKRVYYIYGTDQDISRGYHAHKDLQQVAICLNGSCKFVLDNGKERIDIILDQPNIGLIIKDNIWREMHDFSHDCILLVLASDIYTESDYIRDYDFFLEYVNNDS
ncbi:dTDP-6-deoxy-3,4-keto-hexulose isomerase [Photobacterium damselae subsp. damselae]|nr:dTDP-6-deoxy-3,4-keto-hexulose isomerase [Photobacterium damselae subsp. damselae]